MAGRNATSGFTLIELSMVLVIIALVIGAIVTGQQMVASSKMRNTLSQIASYNSAFGTFRQKYECLPGDCMNASNYYVGGTGNGYTGHVCENGDGDGKINADGFFVNATTTNSREKYNVWCQLVLAKLVSGSYSGISTGAAHPVSAVGYFPALKFGSQAYLLALTLENVDRNLSFGPAYVLFGNVDAPLWSGYDWPTYAFTPTEALSFDGKVDDGIPESGVVRTIIWSGNGQAQEFNYDSSANASCIVTTGLYNTLGTGLSSTSLPVCMLAVQANW